MRVVALGVAVSTTMLGACSLVSLDGLTGGGAGWDGASGILDARGDVGDEAASSSSGGGGDDGAPVDGSGEAPGSMDAGGSGDATVDGAQLPPYRIVFVSSLHYDGNLGGAHGADAKCQALATAAGLPGTFLAWISDGTTSANARLAHPSVPYVLADGQTVVASDWSQLVSGQLAHPIDTMENKMPVPMETGCLGYSGNFVWTDTSDAGAEWYPDQTCNDWASSASSWEGGLGSANDSNGWWTGWCYQIGCDTQARLYCVQQ